MDHTFLELDLCHVIARFLQSEGALQQGGSRTNLVPFSMAAHLIHAALSPPCNPFRPRFRNLIVARPPLGAYIIITAAAIHRSISISTLRSTTHAVTIISRLSLKIRARALSGEGARP